MTILIWLYCNTFLLGIEVEVLPYIALGVTEGVDTQSVPRQDDGVSLPINVQFPFGSQYRSTVYVSV